MTDTEETIDRAAEIAALGLTVDAVFVPFSKSRNKDEKHKTLNWRVTVKRNGREVLATDYSAGIAHAPSYNKKAPAAWNRPIRFWPELAGAFEAESGFALGPFFSWSGFASDKSKPIKPNPLDVIYSLNMDCDVLNYSSFEHWAETFGFDPDSRKGEAIYRACLELALKMRAALGEAGLERLNVIFQDY